MSLLSKIRQPECLVDQLLVGTDRGVFFILSWDTESKSFRTEASADLSDSSCRLMQHRARCRVDPTGEFMVIEVYEGIITVVPLSLRRGKRKKVANGPDGSNLLGDNVWTRIEERNVIDSAFLQNPREPQEKPLLCLLCEDFSGTRRLKVKELHYSPGLDALADPSVEFKDIDQDVRQQNEKDPLPEMSSILIPLIEPPYGLVILSDSAISYWDHRCGKITQKVAMTEPTIWASWTQGLPGSQQYYMADEFGQMWIARFNPKDFANCLRLTKIDGTIPHALCLTNLPSVFPPCVFVGSHGGDSQVVSFGRQGMSNSSITRTVQQVLPGLSPILDFTIMDMGNPSSVGFANEYSTGQARIVAGTGAWQSGSLRSVRSGVEFDEKAVLPDVPGITKLFNLSCGKDQADGLSNALMVSYIDSTDLFCFDSDGNVSPER